MKLSFKLISLIVALGFLPFNTSISLGIILTTLALEIIKQSRKAMESRVSSAENVKARLIYPHFILVIIVMSSALAISFFFPEYFSPFGVAITFIIERMYFFVSQAFKKEG